MDDLIKDFLIETTESIQQLDTDLVVLEREPKNKELLSRIFRIIHTIKGTCGFLGLSRLESLAHAGENILGKIRDEEIEVSPSIISLILESLDVVKIIVSHIEKKEIEPEGNDIVLIKKLNFAAGMIEHNNEIEDFQSKIPEVNQNIQSESKNDNSNSNILITKTEESEKQDAVDMGLKVAQNKDIANDTKVHASNQTVRVSLDILEGLMLIVSELVLTRNQLQQIARSQKDSEFSSPIQRLGHITSELQERVMKTRMQPISNAWTPFPRLVRGLASELGKKIELKMVGEDTELDRQLIEAIKDPLTHMVRNSCDHGIEMPEERSKAGKSDAGIITLKAYHQGGHIIIEISDNGKGLNPNKIKEKILSENLASQEELSKMSDMQIFQYIFKAGFSTASKITAVSGRGVGMDVVKTNIEKINGKVDLVSHLGKGTSFFIKIPLTLAIMSVLIVESRGAKFAIPQINVLELVRAGKNSGHTIDHINDKPVLSLRNTILSLEYLSNILKLSDGNELSTEEISDIVICEVGGSTFGIVVDKVYDTEEIVVKPVAPILKSIEVYSGITLLGDGSIIMILDPNSIFKSITSNNEIQDGNSKDEVDLSAKNDKATSKFLIVRSGKKSLKAIPIELVSRLEEVHVNNIEYSGSSKIVQYRDKFMYLTQLDDDLEEQTKFQRIVAFVDQDKILGIMVDDIVDIVENKVDIVSNLSRPGYLGSLIVNDKATELIDLPYYFESVFGNQELIEESNNRDNNQPSQILMIDDSLFFSTIISKDLNLHGYNVISVENTSKALEILEKNHNFLSIIIDYKIFENEGLYFNANCEKNTNLKNIPIVILSSVLEGHIKSIKGNNIKSCISKFNNSQLLKIINELSSISENSLKFEDV